MFLFADSCFEVQTNLRLGIDIGTITDQFSNHFLLTGQSSNMKGGIPFLQNEQSCKYNTEKDPTTHVKYFYSTYSILKNVI